VPVVPFLLSGAGLRAFARKTRVLAAQTGE